MTSAQITKRALYMEGLRTDPGFREFFLNPLEETRDRTFTTLRNLSATDRELYTAQGVLQTLDAIDDLLSRPIDDLKRMQRKKDKLNGSRT